MQYIYAVKARIIVLNGDADAYVDILEGRAYVEKLP